MRGSKRNQKEIEKDIHLLERFVRVFCKEKHSSKNNGQLCEECWELLQYSTTRLQKCPYHPKPKCKDCQIHCYQPEFRKKIQEIMKFSGMYFVKRGRIDWLIKYFF